MDVLQFRGNRALGEIKMGNKFRTDLLRTNLNQSRQERYGTNARTYRYAKGIATAVEWDSNGRGAEPCTRLHLKPEYASPNLYHGFNRESSEIYSPPHLMGELQGRVKGLS